MTINLRPNFDLSNLDNSSVSSLSALLLGQDNIESFFNLLLSTCNQHMYLTDFKGLDRPLFLQAIFQLKPVPYTYLHGNITYKDLFGDYKDDKLMYICIASLFHKKHLLLKLLYSLDSCATKIVFIGNNYYLNLLKESYPNFTKNICINYEMVNEIDILDNTQNYLLWLKAIIAEKNLNLDPNAILPIFNYCSKKTEHQFKTTLASFDVKILLEQAHFYGNNCITADSVNKALLMQTQAKGINEKFTLDEIEDKFLNVVTTGSQIGQINALSIIEDQSCCFGYVSRITASVHSGEGEVIDIERKSELGGNIHTKGLMILTSLLYKMFAKDTPIRLNANIVFEQSYQEIDGDSASLAEFCCLISAISELPIAQNLAITGSIDQLGNVQAIGGVNEKIEAFYALCSKRNCSNAGVIIPNTNIIQLNLDDKIVTSVHKGEFSIYVVNNIDEALELLLNCNINDIYNLIKEKINLFSDEHEKCNFFQKLMSFFSKND